MFEQKKFELDYAGRKLIVEVGKIANQVNASCTVQYGETMVLATVAMGKKPREGVDFLPFQVEYREKMYAAGKIKGSRFVKREGRPTDNAVLDGRMIDRGMRPLFNESIRHEIQLVLSSLAYDGQNPFNVASIIAGSIALHISDIPWNGPIAGITIGRINGEFVVNPTVDQQKESNLHLILSVGHDGVLMVDADATEITEEDTKSAFEFGMKEVKPVLDFMESIRKEIGKEKVDEQVLLEAASASMEVPLEEKKKVFTEAKSFFQPQLDKYLFNQPIGTKRQRKESAKELLNEFIEKLEAEEKHKEIISYVKDNFGTYLEEEVTKAIIERDQRVDGRTLDQIRPLQVDLGYLPRVHGSGIFSRGETQVLSIVTLGSPGDVQLLDEMTENDTKKRYMHHYGSPPYSFGEPGRFMGAGRREIGHGALAEKALMPVLPPQDEFPYTILVNSEVMGSNGSSSMASTCGSTIALLDAGVPLKKPVAGIAMGLASDGTTYKVLADLQDLEDGEGGMDFKVTGTRDGITAIQMDTKTTGLPLSVCNEAIEKALSARVEILDFIEKHISEPKKELSPYAPRIVTVKIDPEKIGEVIGPGGKIINGIIDACDVQIDIEEDGNVFITGVGDEGVNKAVDWVKNIVKEVEAGELYDGTVVRLMDFGAFVEVLPGKDGLVHISELAPQRVDKVTDIVNVGDKVKVKVIEIDGQGRINLSMKKADPNYDASADQRSAPRSFDKKPFAKKPFDKRR